MTVHFRGRCLPCHDVQCLVPTETKRNERQPRLVIQGWCQQVRIDGTKAIIE